MILSDVTIREELDELGYNRTDVDDVPPELQEQARRGALCCPEGAITIEE